MKAPPIVGVPALLMTFRGLLHEYFVVRAKDANIGIAILPSTTVMMKVATKANRM